MNNETIKNWELLEELGTGGNAVVWKVKNLISNEIYALKKLKDSKRKDKEANSRFLQEIKTLIKTNNKINNIVQLIDYSEEQLWYVMPLAENSFSKMKDLGNYQKIELLLELGKGILELHKLGISHRDIKPDNILYLNNMLFLADFGLVKIEESDFNVTQYSKKRGLGAMSTMAPEMRRSPVNANGIKADIYSFAKTIWIYMTGQITGFDGEYSKHSNIGLHNYNKKFIYLKEIEDIITISTKNDLNLRPSMNYIIAQLSIWLDKSHKIVPVTNEKWRNAIEDIFPINIPGFATWKAHTNCADILSIISKHEQGFCLISNKEIEPIYSSRIQTSHYYKGSLGIPFGFTKTGGKSVLLRLENKDDLLALLIKRIEFRNFKEDINLSYFKIDCVSENLLNSIKEKFVFYLFPITSPYIVWHEAKIHKLTNISFNYCEKKFFNEIKKNLVTIKKFNEYIDHDLSSYRITSLKKENNKIIFKTDIGKTLTFDQALNNIEKGDQLLIVVNNNLIEMQLQEINGKKDIVDNLNNKIDTYFDKMLDFT